MSIQNQDPKFEWVDRYKIPTDDTTLEYGIPKTEYLWQLLEEIFNNAATATPEEKEDAERIIAYLKGINAPVNSPYHVVPRCPVGRVLLKP